MSNITIIKGSQNKGKTRLARLICNDKNYVWLSGRHKIGAFDLSGIDATTKFVIIDDLMDKSDHWKLFLSNVWTIARKYKDPIQIIAPYIIITTELDLKFGDCNFSRSFDLTIYEISKYETEPIPF